MRSLLLITLLTSPVSAADPVYDLLIRNGRVADGTGNPWFLGDVAVRGDRIVAVGRVPTGTAKREIDARGLVVAPGFIDIHSHSDYLLLEDGDAQSKVRQGVTTEVLGEGQSAGPWQGKAKKGTFAGGKVSWDTLGGYFDRLEKSGTAVNVASYVGLDNVSQAVMGESHDRPTTEQIAQMRAVLDGAMKDGAFGLSTMLAMPPGSLATTDDLVELSKVWRGTAASTRRTTATRGRGSSRR
jgi:N-acyl-D-aspartate/D-glutamate deacylase